MVSVMLLMLLASALVPALLLLWFFYSRDHFPEPPGLVARTFLFGAAVCLPGLGCAWALDALGLGFGGGWSGALGSGLLGAAIPEEVCKFAVLRLYVWRKPDFDEPMDGLVYGATVSLGFAALENLLYVGAGGLWVALLRAATAVPSHALTGAIMGAYVGFAKFAPPLRGKLLAAGLLSAIGLHGAYDTFLLVGSTWSLGALAVLAVDIGWARQLTGVMRGGQVLMLPTLPVRPAKAPPAAAAGAARPARRLEAGKVARLVVGAAGSILGALAILLVIGAGFESEPYSLDQVQVLELSFLFGVPASLFALLFRSGLRGSDPAG